MRLEHFVEDCSRRLARQTSRRHVLARLGQLLLGTALLPLLPIDRSHYARAAAPASTSPASTNAAVQDPDKCEYWKYCAIDGFLCSCCGGSSHSCPPGTSASSIMWIGTCHNPSDDRHYVVAYNDCCGKNSCGQCECNRNEGEKPMYRPSRNNDLNWCMANDQSNYHCTVSVILGVAQT